ncbi:MAG: hypothetical protein ABSE64_03790 [Vulcanimicrobiaceae bacterium]|jgi:hypothetical protein
MVKRLALIATIGLLLGLGFALWRAGEEDLPPPTQTQTMNEGQAQGRRAQFASWQFTYNSATTLQDGVTQQIDGIHDGVYLKNGKPFVRMHADRAIYNSLSHDFTVNGPVHFDVDDHGKIRTFDASYAVWTEANQTLSIPGDATVGSGHERLTVSNVTVDLSKGQYTIGKIQGAAQP